MRAPAGPGSLMLGALRLCVCVALCHFAIVHALFGEAILNGVRSAAGVVWQSATGLGTPALLDRIVSSETDLVEDIVHSMQHKSVWKAQGLSMVDGIQYQMLKHEDYPAYQLRVKIAAEDEERFCDPDVKQISGYLDIGQDKHLWFILFESRSNPSKDPLLMWLNGGPGCSSSTGMLFELGPCWVSDKGEGTRPNEWAWNSNANLLFLDQPVQVGYSYTDSDSLVDTSAASAADVYAFLQLFLARFPDYAELPFHIAAESYGGQYAPHIGAEIHRRNKETNMSDKVGPIHIPLTSLMIGNGLSEPQIQFASIPEFACSPKNKYHVFEEGSEECTSLQSKSDTCQKLMEKCERLDNRLICVPTALFCWGALYAPVQALGVNMYDLRRKCDREVDGDLCYPEMGYMEILMNKPHVKSQLGVPSQVTFQSCNMKVNQAFMLQGDSMIDAAALLPPLLEDGIRVLVYAGEADFMCNAIGNHDWVVDFPNTFHDEIANATKTPLFMRSVNGAKPARAGWVIKAGEGAGNLAYAWINEAGHMVPHDQPQVALSMLNKWLANKALTE
ncbi:carboxypeptidase C [Malassezia vespertilionis]|uniref:Carboxypeptidase n=1 Tax=Malassezia vespertilionis TaxID=2020962 RepID=A0A2N1JGD2_9BASI|nr:carboxypeptidase C [Malassezia vespertilionis]PKI85614.1 hypothetical protein MVES_000711 [Malassezia vespertilionis]WFD05424.1 carboxypeptidase C [Malassezia vespertilionis]